MESKREQRQYRQRQKGQHGEQSAAEFLKKQGLCLLEQNYQTRFGEIDLICFDPIQASLVFVEVKLRKNEHYGGALYSITPQKCAKLIQTAELYLARYAEQHQGMLPSCRFDVVLFTESRRLDQQCEWLQNVELL